MNGFLRTLRSELLIEDLQGFKKINSDKPRVCKEIMVALRNHEPFLYFLLENKTNWYLDISGGQVPTAAITNDGDKLGLILGPKCIVGNKNEMAFVIAHELSHFFKGHLNFDIYSGKSDRNIANIAEDALIDDELLSHGTWGTISLKTPFPVFTLETLNFGGMEQNCLEGPKWLNTKFSGGAKTSLNVYNWMIKNDFIKISQEKTEEGSGGEGEKGQSGKNGGTPPPNLPKPGSIVFNKKTGQYGKVVGVGPNETINKVIPLDKAEAEAAVMAQK